MFRKSILVISSRQVGWRIPRPFTSQIPAPLFSRKEFSSASKHQASHGGGSGENSSKSGGYLSRAVIGSIALGAVVTTAYQAGYLDQFFTKDQHASATIDADGKFENGLGNLGEVLPNSTEPLLNQAMEHNTQKIGTDASLHQPKDPSIKHTESQFQDNNKSDLTAKEDTAHDQGKGLPDDSQMTLASDDQSEESRISSGGSLGMKNMEEKTAMEPKEEAPVASVSIQSDTMAKENEMKSTPPKPSMELEQDAQGEGLGAPNSLPDEYHLWDGANKITASTSTRKTTDGHKKISVNRETAPGTSVDNNDSYLSKDGKLVLDLLEAIHAAEKRQSELDAHTFSEEKRMLKEKYGKELKDARARELMYAEEAAILDKELNKERMKAASAIKSLHEKAEEKLNMELKQKESEAELKLKEVHELAKAEMTAAIAREKALQIERLAEADHHINALCMAFYAQSKEARQGHSLHKLALGALALEDSLSKGLPILTEIEDLQTCIEGIDKESLLDLVLSSLPEETQNHGTDTVSQLHQKFDALKGTVRHFSLIPPSGGGILTHSLAHVASWLKVKGVGEGGDGIEGVIERVERYLGEGRVGEAAEALEEGVRGSQAVEIVDEWVRRARNRAVTEQALIILQAYATSMSMT